MPDTTAPTILPLGPALFPDGKVEPLVVRCYHCDMTMWAHGPNAHYETLTDNITCRSCAGLPEAPNA